MRLLSLFTLLTTLPLCAAPVRAADEPAAPVTAPATAAVPAGEELIRKVEALNALLQNNTVRESSIEMPGGHVAKNWEGESVRLEKDLIIFTRFTRQTVSNAEGEKVLSLHETTDTRFPASALTTTRLELYRTKDEPVMLRITLWFEEKIVHTVTTKTFEPATTMNSQEDKTYNSAVLSVPAKPWGEEFLGILQEICGK